MKFIYLFIVVVGIGPLLYGAILLVRLPPAPQPLLPGEIESPSVARHAAEEREDDKQFAEYICCMGALSVVVGAVALALGRRAAANGIEP